LAIRNIELGVQPDIAMSLQITKLTYFYFAVKLLPTMFRSLRSGKEISPWSMGLAICTVFDFSITNRLAEIKAERAAQEMMGYESEDEHEVASCTLLPSPPLQAWSAPSPFTLSPLTPIHDPVELPPPSLLPPPTSAIWTHTSSPKSTQKSKKKPRHKKTDHRKAGTKKCRLKQWLRHMEKTQTRYLPTEKSQCYP